jgi:hypothetical protein
MKIWFSLPEFRLVIVPKCLAKTVPANRYHETSERFLTAQFRTIFFLVDDDMNTEFFLLTPVAILDLALISFHSLEVNRLEFVLACQPIL